jgi:flagellar biogenesis protein FliO
MRVQAMPGRPDEAKNASTPPRAKGPGGLAGWLLQRLGAQSRPGPKLALVERITLAPRQTLSLVEAEGHRLLIATSPEGAPAFYPLDDLRPRAIRSADNRTRIARTSW